ncbi:hypothetical protein DRQ36_10875, partial [bacterium]
LFAFVFAAFGDVPLLMNYQGKLTDAAGVPEESPVSMTFSLWDASSGGNKVWEQTIASVDPTHGLFAVELDFSAGWEPGHNINDFDAGDLYLQIVVGATTLSPRERITSVAHAFNISDTAVTTDKIRDDAVTTAKLADGTSAGQILQYDGSAWQLVDGSGVGNVQAGTADNQTLRWNNAAGQWQFSNALQNDDTDVKATGNLTVEGNHVYGDASGDAGFYIHSTGNIRMDLDDDSDGGNTFAIRDGGNGLVFEVDENGNVDADGSGDFGGNLTLSGSSGSHLDFAGGAGNIFSPTGVDIYIDDDDDGTGSEFYVKTKSGAADVLLFRVDEQGDATVYRKILLTPQSSEPGGSAGELYYRSYSGTDSLYVNIDGTWRAIATANMISGSFIENRPPDGVFGTGQTADFDITGTGEMGGNLYVSGDVGVGMTSPAAKLHVDGDIRLNAGDDEILIYDANGTQHVLGDDASGETDGIVLRTTVNPASGEPIFVVESSGYSQRLRVEHDGYVKTSNNLAVDGTGDSYIQGNLGIGTAAPSTNLDIDGTIRIRGGGPAAGEVLTATDGTGIATWEPIPPATNYWQRVGTTLSPATANDNVDMTSTGGNGAIAGRYDSDRFGILGVDSCGVYGQRSSNNYGFLGIYSTAFHGSNWKGVFGHGLNGVYGESGSGSRWGILGEAGFGAGGFASDSARGYLGRNFTPPGMTTDTYGAVGEDDDVGDNYNVGVIGLAEHGTQNIGGYFSPMMAVEPQTAAPTGFEGGLYYNDTDNKYYYHNGTSWLEVGGGDNDWAYTGGSDLTGQIYHTGEVGIGGTYYPNKRLEVYQGALDAAIDISAVDTDIKLSFRHAGGADETSYIRQTFPGYDLILEPHSGQVGIGTTAPATKLHVLGTSAGDGTWIEGIRIENNNATLGEAAISYRLNTGSNYWIVGMNQNDHYSIANGPSFTDANTKLRILPSGNVGIGTTTPTNLLEVDGEASYQAASDMGSDDADFACKQYVDNLTGPNNYILNLDYGDAYQNDAGWRITKNPVAATPETISIIDVTPASWPSDAVIYGNVINVATVEDGHATAYRAGIDVDYNTFTGTTYFDGGYASSWDAHGNVIGARGNISASRLGTNFADYNVQAVGLSGLATGNALTPFAVAGTDRLVIAGVQSELSGTINNPATMPDTFRVAALWAVDNASGTANHYAGYFDGSVYVESGANDVIYFGGTGNGIRWDGGDMQYGE